MLGYRDVTMDKQFVIVFISNLICLCFGFWYGTRVTVSRLMNEEFIDGLIQKVYERNKDEIIQQTLRKMYLDKLQGK